MDRSFQSFTGSKTPSFLKANLVLFFFVFVFFISVSPVFTYTASLCVVYVCTRLSSEVAVLYAF